MRCRNMVFALPVLLGACDSPASSNQSSASGTHAVTFKAIGRDTYAMIFAAASDHASVEGAVRSQCSGKQWCKVLGWTNASAAASAMPMTDREVAALRFSYTLNRVTGLDEATWS